MQHVVTVIQAIGPQVGANRRFQRRLRRREQIVQRRQRNLRSAAKPLLIDRLPVIRSGAAQRRQGSPAARVVKTGERLHARFAQYRRELLQEFRHARGERDVRLRGTGVSPVKS